MQLKMQSQTFAFIILLCAIVCTNCTSLFPQVPVRQQPDRRTMVSCDGTIRVNDTYFRNPNAPSPYSETRICSVVVQRRSDICQLRLDFVIFDVAKPYDGDCDRDRFTVSGHSQNFIVPPICGQATGQHMYIDVRYATGPVVLSVTTLGDYMRTFDIRVTQYRCNGEQLVPPNCLQHHTHLMDRISSFNFQENPPSDLPQKEQGYFNNLDYTICFRKAPGFCGVTFSLPVPPTLLPNDPARYFGIRANETLRSEEAGAGQVKCPTDYLLIDGTRLCGNRLNPGTITTTSNESVEVFDNSNGPIQIRFVTSNADVSRGFALMYRQNPCKMI